jgi:iduronate 2-sulfatase
VAPRKYWDLYDPGEIPLPATSTPPAGAPDIAIHPSREIRGYGGTPRDRDFTEEEIRNYRHGYYASISFMDAQIGKILAGLEAGGHADDTIVIFTSDHGFHIGEHSLWGKTSNFELDARVPLIVADPSQPVSGGKSTQALAELVDLYPTLAELAGIEKDLPSSLEGVSLAPVLADPTASVQNTAFTQHQQPFYGPRSNWKAWGYSVRTDEWRYTEWRSIANQEILARELYHHTNDPNETINVVEENPDIASKHSREIVSQFDLP